MKNLPLKIISHANNVIPYIILYYICLTIFVISNIANLSMFIPILEIIFGQVETTTVMKPDFSLSITYIKNLFQFYFQYVISAHGKMYALYFVGILLTCSVFISNLFRYFAESIVSKIRIYTVSKLRISIFRHISSFDINFFTCDNKNNIMTNMANDIQVIECSMDDIFKVCFKEPTTIIGFLIVMYHISDRFTMLACIFLPIIGLLITYIVVHLKEKANKTQQTIVSVINTINDMLNNIFILEVFNAKDFFMNKFEKENDTYKKNALSMEYKKCLLPAISEFLGVTIVSFVLVYGGNQILSNKISLSASVFITYIIFFSQAIVPIKNITRSIGNVQRSYSAAERIFGVLQMKNEKKQQNIYIEDINDGIKINNLSFSYDDGPEVLKSVNIEIKKGEKVLFIGKSGSGKTTLLNIIAGLLKNYKGNIYVDENELKDLDLEQWYNIIGFCNQKNFIIYDTVLNNLTFGKNIELSKIMELSVALQTHDFISTMKNGYNTVITNSETCLSGGQIQRLCLLRTLLKDPKILILDEPTSSLDRETERSILNFLIQTDKTIIIVSHHIENTEYFDKIYNIDNGICSKK